VALLLLPAQSSLAESSLLVEAARAVGQSGARQLGVEGSRGLPRAEPTELPRGGESGPAQKRKLLIALDAGHGGPKVGAVRGDLIEKDVTASVVQQIKIRLLTRGYRVVETRPGDADVDLRERVRIANEAGADLFISIHCNAMPKGRASRKVRGVETFFLSADATDEAARRLAEEENGEPLTQAQMNSGNPLDAILFDLQVSAAHHDSARLARAVQKQLVKATRFPDRGVRQAPFAVLNGAKMPAVLVELGFLSHPVEGKELANPVLQGRASTGLLAAIDIFSKIVHARDER